MKLWQKIKRSVLKSAAVVSEKASDLVEAAGELLEESVQRFAPGPIDALEVSNLQAEVDELRATIKGQFTALGSQVYMLHTTDKQDTILDYIKDKTCYSISAPLKGMQPSPQPLPRFKKILT